MKTEALMNKVLAEELKASVPELQEEMVIAVKARGDAWRKFNTIESEYSGEIIDILVQDGDPVEFGQELFLIKEIDV